VANNTVTTLVALDAPGPFGVAVDGAGNVYMVAGGPNGAIKMWTAANNTVTTPVASGLSINPNGVAVDGTGNVYIADTLNNVIKKWTLTNSTLTTLVSSGLYQPGGLAVDGAGNVYIADTLNNAIKKWTAANSNVTTLVSSGLNRPHGVAVDGGGNVYIADSGTNAIKKWTAANNTVTTLVSSGLSSPNGVAVDTAGNIYIADTGNKAIKELPRAFVDPTARLESTDPGSDALPMVLPATANLLAPFAPTSDQPWLTISGIVNGVVSFSFDATTSNRTANITLLGQTIPITQVVPVAPPALVSPAMLANGMFQFAFSNNTPGASFTVLSTTNLALPLADWTVLGPPTNSAPGLFQFTTPASTNDPQRFYRVRSP
jgi:DNA-binding beta-propeller fold protein YncE